MYPIGKQVIILSGIFQAGLCSEVINFIVGFVVELVQCLLHSPLLSYPALLPPWLLKLCI